MGIGKLVKNLKPSKIKRSAVSEYLMNQLRLGNLDSGYIGERIEEGIITRKDLITHFGVRTNESLIEVLEETGISQEEAYSIKAAIKKREESLESAAGEEDINLDSPKEGTLFEDDAHPWYNRFSSFYGGLANTLDTGKEKVGDLVDRVKELDSDKFKVGFRRYGPWALASLVAVGGLLYRFNSRNTPAEPQEISEVHTAGTNLGEMLAGDFEEVELPEERTKKPKRVRFQEYEIQSGDTLLGLADEFFPEEDEWLFLANVMHYNEDVTNPNQINNGQTIKIPHTLKYVDFRGEQGREGFIQLIDDLNPHEGIDSFYDVAGNYGVDTSDPDAMREFGEWYRAGETGGTKTVEETRYVRRPVVVERAQDEQGRQSSLEEDVATKEQSNASGDYRDARIGLPRGGITLGGGDVEATDDYRDARIALPRGGITFGEVEEDGVRSSERISQGVEGGQETLWVEEPVTVTRSVPYSENEYTRVSSERDVNEDYELSDFVKAHIVGEVPIGDWNKTFQIIEDWSRKANMYLDEVSQFIDEGHGVEEIPEFDYQPPVEQERTYGEQERVVDEESGVSPVAEESQEPARIDGQERVDVTEDYRDTRIALPRGGITFGEVEGQERSELPEAETVSDAQEDYQKPRLWATEEEMQSYVDALSARGRGVESANGISERIGSVRNLDLISYMEGRLRDCPEDVELSGSERVFFDVPSGVVEEADTISGNGYHSPSEMEFNFEQLRTKMGANLAGIKPEHELITAPAPEYEPRSEAQQEWLDAIEQEKEEGVYIREWARRRAEELATPEEMDEFLSDVDSWNEYNSAQIDVLKKQYNRLVESGAFEREEDIPRPPSEIVPSGHYEGIAFIRPELEESGEMPSDTSGVQVEEGPGTGYEVREIAFDEDYAQADTAAIEGAEPEEGAPQDEVMYGGEQTGEVSRADTTSAWKNPVEYFEIGVRDTTSIADYLRDQQEISPIEEREGVAMIPSDTVTTIAETDTTAYGREEQETPEVSEDYAQADTAAIEGAEVEGVSSLEEMVGDTSREQDGLRAVFRPYSARPEERGVEERATGAVADTTEYAAPDTAAIMEESVPMDTSGVQVEEVPEGYEERESQIVPVDTASAQLEDVVREEGRVFGPEWRASSSNEESTRLMYNTENRTFTIDNPDEGQNYMALFFDRSNNLIGYIPNMEDDTVGMANLNLLDNYSITVMSDQNAVTMRNLRDVADLPSRERAQYMSDFFNQVYHLAEKALLVEEGAVAGDSSEVIKLNEFPDAPRVNTKGIRDCIIGPRDEAEAYKREIESLKGMSKRDLDAGIGSGQIYFGRAPNGFINEIASYK